MSTQAIQAGEAFIQLNVNSDELQKGLLNVSSRLEGLGGEVQKLASLTTQNFSALSESLGSVAPMIELTGFSISALAPGITIVENLALSFYRNTLQITTLISQQGVLAAVNQLYTSTVHASTAAIAVNGAVMSAHPIMWIAGIIAGVVAITAVAITVFDAFTRSAEENAKAAEEACKQNDSYRASAKQCIGTLEELSSKEALNADQKKASKSAWNELQRSADGLGISLHNLGISFDEGTGKMNASAEAMAKFREAMRVKELKDLNDAIQAQEKHIDNLQKELNKDGGLSNGLRTFGTWVTFGWVDNAEEIQAKIDETREKLQENLDRQKTVVDFSAEYKENEAKLQEIYDKEKEEAKNALAVKLDAIHQEMEERRALLKMLIAEASARSDLSEEEMKKLKERQAALAALDAEEKKRVADAEAEDDAQAKKIESDFFAKRAENEENIKWKRDLEADPDASLKTASSSSDAADAAFRNAVTALKNADETTSKEELERLNAEVEKTKKEAEKWYARREEAQKAAEEAEKKAAADKEAAEALKDSRLDEIKNLKESKEEEIARENEQKEWDSLRELDSARAEEKAKTEHDRLTSGINAEYAELENLAKNGASDEVYQAQLKKVQDMEREIDLWADRLEDISLGQMEDVQENSESAAQSIEKIAGPNLLTSGSADAQRKFLELQKDQKDPAIAQREETNNLLRRGIVSWENMESQFGVV